jgi:hypothetical protein
VQWYYATMRTLLLDLTSVFDFTVANEPVIILTSDTVVERDEPTFEHVTKVGMRVFVSTSIQCLIKPV